GGRERGGGVDWGEKGARRGVQPLPAGTVDELRRLAASHEPPRLPAGAGIGYRRRFMRRGLFDHWSICVPGALARDMEDDGRTIVYWNGEPEGRGSTLSAPRREAGPPLPAPVGSEPAIRTEYTVAKSGNGHVLTAIAEQNPDGGTLNTCIVTIWMERESLRPFADRIAASIKFKPPQ